MVEVLNYLKEKRCKLAVLSNKPHQDVVGIVKRYFGDLFDVIAGAKPGYNVKPDPQLGLEVLNEMKLKPEEVLFVGDSNVDIYTAQNLGLDSVACLYGYRSEKELRGCKANYYIKNPYGLMKYFREEIDGILLVDKPIGLTSQDVVTKVKRVLNVEKAGHAGTLDPFASGLLVILLGDATKLSNYLLEENKEYLAQIVVGKSTDTLDIDGNVTTIKKVKEMLDVDKVLDGLVGKISLVPPMYSAIKVNGQKMYDLARKGEIVDLKARENEIFSLKRVSELKYQDDELTFEVLCNVSKGTYIRSLCQEIGNRLGYPAFVKTLRRVKSGQMSIDDACQLDDVNSLKVVSIIDALKGKEVVHINDVIYNRVKNGMKIYLNNEKADVVYLEYNKRLVAIYELFNKENKQYIARRVWK